MAKFCFVSHGWLGHLDFGGMSYVRTAKELKIPTKIIEKKPSAELWQGQTDEDELGVTYQELDSVLKGEINSGEVFEKVQALRKAAEHKKKLPPVFEVGEEQ